MLADKTLMHIKTNFNFFSNRQTKEKPESLSFLNVANVFFCGPLFFKHRIWVGQEADCSFPSPKSLHKLRYKRESRRICALTSGRAHGYSSHEDEMLPCGGPWVHRIPRQCRKAHLCVPICVLVVLKESYSCLVIQALLPSCLLQSLLPRSASLLSSLEHWENLKRAVLGSWQFIC